MVALLVLLTFVTFIAIDYLLNREKYRFQEAPAPEPVLVIEPMPEPVAAGIRMPERLAYHPGHTWALDMGDGRIRVGVDEFGANLLGTVEKVDLPQRGRWLRQGDKGVSVTTKNGQATLASPAEGEVLRVNSSLAKEPGSLSGDPYGRGWLVELLSPDAVVGFRNLLSGAPALRWMEEQMQEIRQVFSPQMATAQDGGLVQPRHGDELPPEVWQEQVRHFFKF